MAKHNPGSLAKLKPGVPLALPGTREKPIGDNQLAEAHNALGRSDLEFSVAGTRWVLEFKFARQGDDPEALLARALSQSADRQYGSQSPEARLMHMGLVFSGDKRQFVAYKARAGQVADRLG